MCAYSSIQESAIPSFSPLNLSLGHYVVDIMPRVSPVHLPPRGVTWDRSYICIEMSPLSGSSSYYIIHFTIVCGSVVHVTLKPKDAHHRCLFLVSCPAPFMRVRERFGQKGCTSLSSRYVYCGPIRLQNHGHVTLVECNHAWYILHYAAVSACAY